MGLAVLAGFAGYTAIEKVQDLVPVVVATQTIEPHQQITQNMVKTVEVPALGRADNVVDDPSLVVGGYSTSRIFANQTIIQPMVAKQFDETGASGLALSIPKEDLRAISFPTDNANCVNGQVKKGDHVDIIVTLHSDVVGGGANTPITKTILQNVEVFGTSGGGNGGDDGQANISSIALLLNLNQAEIVKHAYTVGDVSYALTPGNSVPAKTSGYTNSTLLNKFGFVVKKQGQQ